MAITRSGVVMTTRGGHAIDVNLFDVGGAFFGGVSFACHPSTQTTSSISQWTPVISSILFLERLRIAMREGSYAKAWDQGLYILERFNASEQEVSTGVSPRRLTI
jgi:hypothetical protein